MDAVRSLIWQIQTKGDTKELERVEKRFDGVKEKAGQIDKKLTETGKSMQTMGSKMGKVGSSFNKKLTLPIAAVGAAGVKMSMDLQDSINKVTTLADQDVLPVDKIQEEVRAISDASGIAQDEIAEAAYSALSAGVESKDVMEFVRSGIDLTKAGFTDMDTAIDSTTTVLNAYGDAAYDVGKIHDIFVQTQDKGKISVDELGKNIGRVVPTASTLGINLDQLGASYAILTAKGQNAQLATTNLNAMLGEMGKSGSQVDKILRKRTGKSFAQLTEEGKNVGEILGVVKAEADRSGKSLADMFGNKSASDAANTLLSEGVEGYTQSLNDMNNATGKTAANAKTMEGDNFKIQKAITQTKNAVMDLGVVLAPYIGKAAEFVSKLTEKFSGLGDGTKKNIVAFGGILAAIGPVLTIGGKIFVVVGKVLPLLGTLASGIGTVIGVLGGPLTLGIAAAVAGGVALYKNWDKVKVKAAELKDNVSEKWQGLKSAVSETITSKVDMVKDGFENARSSVSQGWENLKQSMANTLNSKVSMIKDGFDRAVSSVRDKWEKLKTFLANPIKGTVSLIQKGASKVKSRFDGSHKVGAYSIPKDNYHGLLHKNEMVLTADTANVYRSLGGTEKQIPTPVVNPQPKQSSDTIKTTNSKASNITNTFNINIHGVNDGSEAAIEIKKELDNYFKNMGLVMA